MTQEALQEKKIAEIAQKIVASHGGEITVFSSPEEGTRFVLTFLR